MQIHRALSSMDIAASGLAAERLRMEVAAGNIANVHTTSTPEGGPYQRMLVRLASDMKSSTTGRSDQIDDQMQGVRIAGVARDTTEAQRVYNPGHPDADEDGYLLLPNVQLPIEMIDLMTASRAYEANLKSLSVYRQMAEQSLSLMNGRAS